MRDLVPALACVVGLMVVLVLFGQAFNSATQEPAHAMETAKLRADLAATKAELDKTRTELEKVRGELKQARDGNQELREKVAELETPTTKKINPGRK